MVPARAHNFNPGPAALPLEVLQQAQEDFVEYQGLGMSIMEMSHRSKQYEQLNDETQALLLELLGLGSEYTVLFMGGGASMQFALVPLNFLHSGKTASYIVTGSFAEKALEEARSIGKVHIAADTQADNYSRLPAQGELEIAQTDAYVHMTSNNTIEGSQFHGAPDTGLTPLIADMTSHLLSRPIDPKKYAMLYAGAQKNLGPAGVTVAIIREDALHNASKTIPKIMRYATYAENRSLYNTPPVHAIYMVNLMLKWVQRAGGVAEMERRNVSKANLLYDVIDRSGGFYTGLIEPDFRSIMNITWRMQDEQLEQQFVEQSERQGFVHLAGHRSVGGLRASAYNAVPYESCEALAQFMIDFQQRNG